MIPPLSVTFILSKSLKVNVAFVITIVFLLSHHSLKPYKQFIHLAPYFTLEQQYISRNGRNIKTRCLLTYLGRKMPRKHAKIKWKNNDIRRFKSNVVLSLTHVCFLRWYVPDDGVHRWMTSDDQNETSNRKLYAMSVEHLNDYYVFLLTLIFEVEFFLARGMLWWEKQYFIQIYVTKSMVSKNKWRF